MSGHIEVDLFTKELFDLLEETFEQHQGIYLDKGASFLQTLETISAEEASRAASPNSATIAAHVRHVSFYLNVIHAYLLNKEVGKVDWRKIWSTTKSVTPKEWDDLKQQLDDAYQGILSTLENLETWNDEKPIGGSLAVLVHTAYHLGAIRQAVRAIK